MSQFSIKVLKTSCYCWHPANSIFKSISMGKKEFYWTERLNERTLNAIIIKATAQYNKPFSEIRVGEWKTFAFRNIMKPIAKKIKPATKFFSEILARIKLILENKFKENTLMYFVSNHLVN
jgi:hypothetical protein